MAIDLKSLNHSQLADLIVRARARQEEVVKEKASKLRDKIKSDMPVVLTRDDDTFVALDHRVVNSVDWNGAVFVSIHLNKVHNKKLCGAVV